MGAEDVFDLTKVNYSGLSEGETAFAKALNDMIQVLEQLEQGLLAKGALWEGSAKTVFDEVRLLWNREANDMSQFVQALKDNINITSMNMREVDRINSQIFDGR
jgi:uncharacterized protein YukE